MEADLLRKNNLATNTYDQLRKLQQDLDDARKAVKSLESRNSGLEVSISNKTLVEFLSTIIDKSFRDTRPP